MNIDVIKFRALTVVQKRIELRRWIMFVKQNKVHLLTEWQIVALKRVANSESLRRIVCT